MPPPDAHRRHHRHRRYRRSAPS